MHLRYNHVDHEGPRISDELSHIELLLIGCKNYVPVIRTIL